MPESSGMEKPKVSLGLRWRNNFLEMCRHHKCRPVPGEAPSVGQSIIAIMKTSSEPPLTPALLLTSPDVVGGPV